jgi:hypothetical protein
MMTEDAAARFLDVSREGGNVTEVLRALRWARGRMVIGTPCLAARMQNATPFARRGLLEFAPRVILAISECQAGN